MNRNEVLEHLCQTVALAYRSIGDYDYASDGFCDRCPNAHNHHFRHDGVTLRYVRAAVVAKLKADGYIIGPGFDRTTGDEITEED